MKKKKIGILTYYANVNYGSSLQAFALSRYLENMGYKTYIVDYMNMKNRINRKMKYKTYFNRIKTALLHPKIIPEMIRGKKVALKSLDRNNDITKKFRNFNDKYLNIFSGEYLDFDFFICGSDQVWKLTAPGLHETFFLRFTDCKKRISYAASLGSKEIPYYNKKRLKKYLKEFKAISVREDDAQELLFEKLGVKSSLVLDPVLLVGKDFWETCLINYSNSIKSESYVFCYFLDEYGNYVDEIIKNSFRLNCRIVIVDSGVQIPELLYEKSIIVQPSPFEFLYLLKNSSAIFTDSFHGTAFSILFNKRFWTMPRNYLVYPGQSSRIESLLRFTGLQNRYVSEGFCNDEIDYYVVNEKVDNLRKKSIDFLKTALEKC